MAQMQKLVQNFVQFAVQKSVRNGLQNFVQMFLQKNSRNGERNID